MRDHYSAYLAMHADDPVQWQLWDEGVLVRAQQEQKLIFISSGYFSCHWCHVMQRESFQDELIATLLNNRFIVVKLDRELNPELDAHLLEFVEKTRGAAGWPLNVFLTPKGHPLIGSGYLPAEEFLSMIKRLQVRWENEGPGLMKLAEEASRDLDQALPVVPTLSRRELIGVLQQRLLDQLFSQADLLEGGLGEGAKFPQVPLLRALMSLPKEEELDEYLKLTLEQMVKQGLHDHIGGGFFRYTVDPGWQQPHFEKMLYDNAQLSALYLDAAVRWQSNEWRQVGLSALDALLRDFSHLHGGYVSSLSALDGEGVEGGYYLWNRQQIESLLPLAEWQIFNRAWRMQEGAEWPGGLPVPVMDAQALSISLRIPLSEAKRWEVSIRDTLLQHRASRSLPRDEKRLAAWNGLVLSAVARGVKSTVDEHYRQHGERLQAYLTTHWDGEQLWRVLSDSGEGLVVASLEDYAYVAQGLLDWADAVNDSGARRLASRLTGEAFYRFFRDGKWLTSTEDAALIRSKPLLSDRELPSAAAVIASLGRRFDDASPLLPSQINAMLFADPQGLMDSPLDYPGTIAEIKQLQQRSSRLILE